MMIRFSRFRLNAGAEADALALLRRHAAAVRAADGCETAILGQAQHPSTEFVLIAQFRDEPSLRRFEGRLRSEPSLGGDQFALLRLTSTPPDLAEYVTLPE